MNMPILIKELDRYYMNIISLIGRKDEYSEMNYENLKRFYRHQIKNLRVRITKQDEHILKKYDLERGFSVNDEHNVKRE
ncbi:MAG: hypothetical protein KGV59_01575 [Tenacibaculum sp.]|nr:hypothetical protein [Tenacibaculum sp.]